MAAGTVLSLHRWPVKSMGGETVDALELDLHGALEDRARALFDVHRGAPRRLTARQAPGMLRWSARAGGTVVAPDGREFDWHDPELPVALETDLGRPVALCHEPDRMQDLPDSLLVTVQGTHEAVEGALGRPLDLRRWRTNAHVALDAAPFAEEGWEGRELRIGNARFALLHPCERCVIPTRDPDTTVKDAEILRWLTREHRGLFGMNARPLAPATIRVGDPVQVT